MVLRGRSTVARWWALLLALPVGFYGGYSHGGKEGGGRRTGWRRKNFIRGKIGFGDESSGQLGVGSFQRLVGTPRVARRWILKAGRYSTLLERTEKASQGSGALVSPDLHGSFKAMALQEGGYF